MKDQTATVQIGQIISIIIKKMGINGEGIGYYQQKLVFVPQALPNELIQCEITKIKPHFLRGKLLSYQKPSSWRNLQPPALYNQVGGLELAHLKYSAQLKFKRSILKQALQHFKPAGYQHYFLASTIGMANPWHYRNKAQFQLQVQAGHVTCGLYQNHTHQVVDSLQMPTQSKLTLSVLQRLMPIIEQLNLPIYDEQKQAGIFKTVVVRQSQARQEVQLTLITHSRKFPKLKQFLQLVQQDIPEIQGIFQNYNPKTTSEIWGEETKLLWGQEYLPEVLNQQQFLLSPRAFLQLNYEQTQKLYQLVRKALNPQAHDIIVDAYAGVGTIGLSIAPYVQQVVGSEIIPEAVHDANLNAQVNHLTNAHYQLGTTAELYPQWLQQGIHPTGLVVDPPRTGLEHSLVQLLVKQGPQKLLYVSCNPSTLARDLRLLTKSYHVKKIQPLDMFPQTPHVESLTILQRR